MFHAARRIVSPIIYLLLAGLFLGSPSIRLAQAKAAMPGVNRARTSSSGLSVPDTLAHAFYSDTSTTALAALGCLQTSTYNAGYHPRSLAVGDLDRDGKLDLAVANWYGYTVGILRGDGNGGFLLPAQYSAVNPSFVALGDLNGDGALDLEVANADANTVSVMLNNGSGGFSSATPYSVGNNPLFIAVADFNADGKLDLAVANFDSSFVSVLLGTGGGAMQSAMNYNVGANPRSIGVGDFNSDGAVDLAVANSGSNTIAVLLGSGTGTFGAPSMYLAGANPYSVAVGDLDGDNKLDLVIGNGGGTTVSVLMGAGNGSFASAVSYTAGYVQNGVTLGDLNNDGVLDVAVANGASNTVSVLLGTGIGTFQTAVDYSVGSDPVTPVIADLNGDGRQDLAVANFNTHNVSVFIEYTQDLTPPTGSIAINQGAGATASPNVTLNLAAQDVGCGVASMAFSNDGVTFSAFESYASTKAWALPAGDGSKTVFVKFKDRADNTSPALSATIVLDQVAPTGAVVINNGAAYATNRNVSLGLAGSDSGTGVRQMYLFDGVTSSGWISYTTSAAWPLAAGDGSKMVTARFRDLAGNISAPVTDTIVLDTLAPSVSVSPLSSYQFSPTFSVTVLGTDATSGVASYDLEFRDGLSGSWTGWLTATTATSASFSGQDGHTYSFRVRAHDNAGNTSAFSSGGTTTTVDATPPVADPLLINFGALQTTGITVGLSLNASDAASGVSAMSFSNDGTTWSAWQPYATTAIWSLSAVDGEKTVYGRFRDAAGNISAVVSDTIVLNMFVGTDYGLTINNGAIFTNQTTVTLTIGAHLGTTQMQVSNDGGFAGVSWEPYSGSKTWQISQYGTYVLPRVVYLKYKDQNGVVSSTYQDDIILDVLPPQGRVSIVPADGARSLASAGVTLQLSASDDVSGVAGMRVSNQPNVEAASWQTYVTSLAWNIGSSARVYVQFRDYAGNISQTYVAAQRQPIYLPGIWR